MSAEKLGTKVRKEQIARAALSLIATQGIEKLCVSSIARRVGIVSSAIYRHFKNKEEILDTALEHIQNMLLDNVKEVCEETTDPLDRIRRLLFRHIKMIRENQAIPRIVFSEYIFSGPAKRKTKVYSIIRGYLHKVDEIVQQGQREGRIKSDFDPGTISMMFLGMIQPAAVLWLMSDGQFDVTKHAEKSWKMFSEAILKE